ncbi:unnamed protein product [Polarella glacialis]|uniref:Uncharacterized protein n=1 Tax=Polarella glacialis TaxID=89957 RepID=A0A813DDV2_POLGL|nr:unnamed protein product [Polarella glacialis]
MSSAFGMCCCGILVFPMALLLLGYNERRFVCDRKDILYAESKADVLGCSPQNIKEGVVYFSCDLDQASVQTFTPSIFRSIGIGSSIDFKSTVGAQPGEFQKKRRGKHSPERTVYTSSQRWVSHQVDATSFSTLPEARYARSQVCPDLPNIGNPKWPADLSQSTETDSAQTAKAGPFTISNTLLQGGNAGGLRHEPSYSA